MDLPLALGKALSRGEGRFGTRRGRVLGIDAGERRVGVAMSDETRLLATPLTVLDRRAGLAPVLDSLAALARREGVTQIVVGLPLNADGSSGRQAKRASDFARVVERVIGVPVGMWDERLSTREAEVRAREAGRNVRRLRKRGTIDALAAAAILQDYLDNGQSAVPVDPRTATLGRAERSDRASHQT